MHSSDVYLSGFWPLVGPRTFLWCVCFFNANRKAKNINFAAEIAIEIKLMINDLHMNLFLFQNFILFYQNVKDFCN